MDKELYINIEEACRLLGVSRPTFNAIRKERGLTEIAVGKRVRFIREQVLKLVSEPRAPAIPVLVSPVDLIIGGKAEAIDLRTAPGIFDLRRIRKFDPYGVLNLFCTLVDLANKGQNIRLEVEDNFICNHLRSLGFFLELEKIHKEKIVWDSASLKTSYQDVLYPISLTNIRLEKQEAPTVHRLAALLREQGFSEAIGGFIGWIIGELVDNSMTHLVSSGFAADCYLLAQRFVFPGFTSNCVIIGAADIGPGIHNTLRRNPKYAGLTDWQAFLSSFKPGVSSWTEYERGKGLTDVLTIAMGNESVLRAESGRYCLDADFRKNTRALSELRHDVPGTRFALVLIDHDFKTKTRDEVSAFIDMVLGEL